MTEDAPIFATELRYHRALSDRGVTIFVLSLAGITAGVCVLLLWSRLWPIVPFVAGDAVFLAVTMRLRMGASS